MILILMSAEKNIKQTCMGEKPLGKGRHRVAHPDEVTCKLKPAKEKHVKSQGKRTLGRRTRAQGRHGV